MLAIANQDPQGGSILCGEAYPLNQVFLDEIMGAAPIDEDDDVVAGGRAQQAESFGCQITRK